MRVGNKNSASVSGVITSLLFITLSVVLLTATCIDCFSDTNACVQIEVCENDADSKSNEIETEPEVEDTYFSNFNFLFQFTLPKSVIYPHYFSLKVETISETIFSPPPEA